MIEKTLAEAKRHMDATYDVLKRELISVRTGRASVALVEHLPVEAYGTSTPLIGLAGLSVPEARLLVVQPYDKKLIPDIERAISKSDLGITPSNDGTVIRLPFPPLTEERRRELVKLVRVKVEEARVAARNVRRDALDHVRKAEKEKLCSEDQARKSTHDLQKITDEMIEKIAGAGQQKEKDVLEV